MAPATPNAGAPRIARDVMASHTSSAVPHSMNSRRAGNRRWSIMRTRPSTHSMVGGMALTR